MRPCVEGKENSSSNYGNNGHIKPRLNEEESRFVRQLIGMANNLNQVAKCCHEEGVLKAMLYFENYRNQMDDLLKKLNLVFKFILLIFTIL